MRPQSIIGLIVAALMVVGGLILCLLAGNMAESAGVQLFTKVENGTTQFAEKAFTDSPITKIELNVRDTDVNIIGGQESSYVEFLNFDDKYYNYNESGKTITISELKDIESLLKFWENGFTFKGVRNVLSSLLGLGEQITGQKVINIYLSDESDKLNNIELVMGTGNVIISDVSIKTDYVIKLASGSVSASKVTNSSKLEVICSGELTLDLESDTFSTLLVNSAADGNKPVSLGHFRLNNTCVGTSDITLTDGSVSVDGLAGANGTESWILNLKSSNGKITVNGTDKGTDFDYTGRFTADTQTHYSLTIVSEKATITVSQPNWKP